MTTGDRNRALDGLFREHYRRLVVVASLLLDDRGAAEEVVQEAFVQTYRAWDRIEDRQAAPAYLRATVVNLARSRLRRLLVARRHPPGVPRNAPATEDTVAMHDDERAVVAALRTLPRRQRECLALRYYLDLPEVEIAATLGVSNGAVKAYTHRGLAALASKLEDRR